jgi:hypothetical protein
MLPDLKVTDSSEALLTGRAPPFRLLARAVRRGGEPLPGVSPVLSEPFVVATARVKGAAKAEIPHVDDSVSKIEGLGVQTQRKLEDIAGAAAAAGVSNLAVPTNSVLRVGQFRELVELAERNKPLRETLKQVRVVVAVAIGCGGGWVGVGRWLGGLVFFVCVCGVFSARFARFGLVSWAALRLDLRLHLTAAPSFNPWNPHRFTPHSKPPLTLPTHPPHPSQQVLRLTKGWDTARDHARRAVHTDAQLRCWHPEGRAEVGLVFRCAAFNLVDVEHPAGLLRRRASPGRADQVRAGGWVGGGWAVWVVWIVGSLGVLGVGKRAGFICKFISLAPQISNQNPP